MISTEVIEHVYAPREWAKGCLRALKPGGRLICTTPYHGYVKNLAISLLGRWDFHANPALGWWPYQAVGSRSLSRLLNEAGFVNLKFRGAGRLPFLWMTMIVSAEAPE